METIPKTFRISIEIADRLDKNCEKHGDVTRHMNAALVMYLDSLERPPEEVKATTAAAITKELIKAERVTEVKEEQQTLKLDTPKPTLKKSSVNIKVPKGIHQEAFNLWAEYKILKEPEAKRDWTPYFSVLSPFKEEIQLQKIKRSIDYGWFDIH